MLRVSSEKNTGSALCDSVIPLILSPTWPRSSPYFLPSQMCSSTSRPLYLPHTVPLTALTSYVTPPQHLLCRQCPARNTCGVHLWGLCSTGQLGSGTYCLRHQTFSPGASPGGSGGSQGNLSGSKAIREAIHLGWFGGCTSSALSPRKSSSQMFVRKCISKTIYA